MDFESAEHERIYRALRSAVGKGGSAANELGLEGTWRWVRAKWLAEVSRKSELAAEQAFPDRATEALPYYERLLQITPRDEASIEDRQIAVARAYALQLASDIPDLLRALQQIDARFTLVVPPAHLSVTTQAARAFDGYAGELPMGDGRKSTRFPNYSSDFEVYTVLELGGGAVPTTEERDSIAAARRLLHDVLPAHNTFQVATHRGFTLDVDRLDLTSFGG
jgi:hypothetical protein